MRRKASTRILSVLLAVGILLSAGALWNLAYADATFLGASLGASDSSLGESGEASEADEWLPQTREVKTAGSMAELKTAIGTTGDIYVRLTDSFTITERISIGANRHVTIDGMKTHKLTQQGGGENYELYNGASSEVTLKDVTVEGRTIYGIIRSHGAGAKGIFDNVTYEGPQPYYGHGGGNEMIIRNGGSFRIKENTDPAQEFNECAHVTFDGGKTTIIHAMDGRNTNAVFFMVHGSGSSIRLINGADVTITSGDYIIYNDASNYTTVTMGDNTRLDITAGGFNRAFGHYLGAFTMGENAYFSYRQTGTPHLSESSREMIIDAPVTIGKNSTFLYSSPVGLRLGFHRVTLNEPRLVSIYNSSASAAGALYSDNASWTVNNVNAVNYWLQKDGENAAPSRDSAGNLPTYLWNTWRTTENGASVIGDAFSFSSTKANVTAEGGIADVLGRNAILKDILKFNTTPKRIVLGNLDSLEVEKIRVGERVVRGSSGGDVMVLYESRDSGSQVAAGPGLPLDISSYPTPMPRSEAAVVANARGLRAAVKTEVEGALELVAVPENIYFGEHTVPAVTTVYRRKWTSPAGEDGEMQVRVRDTRGETGEAWRLVVEAAARQVNGKERLPASYLLFRTHWGLEYTLDKGAAPVYYGQGNTGEEDVLYPITWGNDQGLLAKVGPGGIDPGSYAVVLNWSVQEVPDSE